MPRGNVHCGASKLCQDRLRPPGYARTMPIETSIQLDCPVDGCNFTAHFPAGPLGDPSGAAREECLAALHLEHPNHPLTKALRDPLAANADDSVTADVN